LLYDGEFKPADLRQDCDFVVARSDASFTSEGRSGAKAREVAMHLASELKTLFVGPALYQARSPWGAISAVLVTVLICAVAFYIGLAVVLFSWGIVLAIAGQATEETTGAQFEALARSSVGLDHWVGMSIAITVQALTIALVWLFAGRKRMWREVLAYARPAPSLGTCLLAGGLLVVVTSLFDFLIYAAWKHDSFADAKWLIEGLRSPLWPGTVLLVVIGAPLSEELLFRGYLFSALAQSRLGLIGGGLLSNVGWTVLHVGYSSPGLLSVYCTGLVLTWLLWRTGSIWVPITAHAVNNAQASAFVYIFAPGI
jgi:membrane protease YdiL (CAAX protease family)